MELEELKLSWDILNEKLEKQHKLSARLIEQATRHNYRSILNNIAWPEFAGSIICLAGAVVLVSKFGKLDSIILQVFGIVSFIFLLMLPVLSFESLRGLKRLNISTDSYANTIKVFVQHKIRFLKIQKLAIGASYIFNIVLMPVVTRIMDGKDITHSKWFWLFMVPVSIIFLYFFSRWALGCYKNSLNKAEIMLSGMED